EGDLRYIFRDADGFSSPMKDGPFPYSWALRKEIVKNRHGQSIETSTKIGICFVTTEVVSGLRGWAGEIPVLVGLSNKGTIQGIKVLPGVNRETPGFIDPLYDPDFDGQFRGRAVGAPLELGVDIDGVTGATVSVQTVNEGVRRASRKAAVELLGIDPGVQRGGKGAFLPVKPGWLLFLGIVGIAVAGYAFRPGKGFRFASLALALLLLGILPAVDGWQAFYPTGADLSRAFTGNVPPGPTGREWLLLMGTTLLLTLIAGKLFCAWVCPFGAAMEILHRLVPWKISLSERWDGRLRKTRFLFLFGLPAVVIIADDPGALRFEPLSALFHPRSLTLVSGLLVAWVLLGSALVERFYCKFLCPVGALVDWLTENRWLGRKAGVVCGGCFRGEKGCRFLREAGKDFASRRDRLRGDCIC
ncbi:MAG: 4Fe-4S binding protein, partial [Planctomycetota bacterium]